MRKIREGDVVVLKFDNIGNGVPDLERYVGTAGVVISTRRSMFYGGGVSRVSFDMSLDAGHIWFYPNTSLEVIGDIR